jgi:hypothetical protein
MSEEDLIKAQLAKLFTDALLSDAAKDGRLHFTTRIAEEFRGQISETMAEHEKSLRAEADSLRRDLVETMLSERTKLRRDLESLAAAPMAAGGPHGARSDPLDEYEDEASAKPGVAPKANRAGDIMSKNAGSDQDVQTSQAPSPQSKNKGLKAYLDEAPSSFIVLMILLAVLCAIAVFVAVWALGREPAESSDAANLEEVCASFRAYNTAPTPDATPAGDADNIQDELAAPQASPLTSLENVLAAKCPQTGQQTGPQTGTPSAATPGPGN